MKETIVKALSGPGQGIPESATTWPTCSGPVASCREKWTYRLSRQGRDY